MFNRFTSMLHHAVEALVPAEPLKKEFVAHWKDITSYFTENKEHRVSVDQTRIPVALELMLEILVCEEEETQGLSGPCVEYLLRSDIVDTLYSLARADCPPGMKQCVLQFFTKLLSRIKQPLLPYMNVHTPMQRLVRLCGETKAGPTEAEEVHFLCTLCAKVKTEPHLVSFFLQQNLRPVPPAEPLPVDSGRPGSSSFILIESLLKLMSSADARVAVKACEGVLLCTTLTDPACVHSIVHSTDLCEFLTKQLCTLYDKLPKVMDPAHIESVDVHWGLDVTSDMDDMMMFPGKRSFISFLSWLDFCDQLSRVAHPDIANVLAARLHAKFLTLRLEPAILQTSETGSITATALFTRCLSLLTAPALIQAFGKFVLGEDLPETSEDGRQTTNVQSLGCESGTEHKLKRRLIERCDSLSEEVCLSSLKLFEALLMRPTESVVHSLLLHDLLSRSYCRTLDEGEHFTCDDAHVADIFDLCDNACVARDVCTSGATRQAAMQDSPPDVLTNSLAEGGDDGVGSTVVMATQGGSEDGDMEVQGSHVVMTTQGGGDAGDAIVMNGDISAMTYDVIDTGTALEEDTACIVGNPAACPSPHVYYDMHEIVASFLNMLSNEVKSSYQSADAGYDSYLRDAHKQFSDVSSQCAQFGWPTRPVCQGDGQTDTFHEGPFLKMLLDKLSRMLQQSYDINLQLTSVVARLALLPHPNIHEYLLNPLLPLQDNCRTLPVVLKKVAADVEHRMKSMPSFQVRLMMTRKHLLGKSTTIRRKSVSQPKGQEDEHFLSGTIVLEEFSKELAAIVFVKYHEATAEM